VLLAVKQGHKRGEYWFEEVGDSWNLRAENNLFMIWSSIISVSVLAVLSS
jgi:hypothetical protein